MELFLRLFDQFRYITGCLLILLLLCHPVQSHRPGYWIRVTIGYLTALLLALLYVPLESVMADAIRVNPAVTAPYWLLMSFVPVGFVLFCYETNLAGALFRSIMASVCENTATVLVRDLFVLNLFPAFPVEHTVAYVLILLAIYAVVYGAAYAILLRQLTTDEADMYPNPRGVGVMLVLVYVAYTAIVASNRVICESVILPLRERGEFLLIYHYVQWFLIFGMFLTGVVMGAIMISVYRMVTLENEKQIVTRMVRDRKAQYELARENIEMINRKAHDLKHQIRALELTTDDERRQQLRQTRKAIDFYDAVVKTGNEALDTLLTEKSVYCQNRGIRLSCTVGSLRLDAVGVVDLYTLLGNAIDNAIEAVEALEDPEKKTISLTIRDQGQMLFFQIENYYSGSVSMKDGLPITTKRDTFNHGFGTRSIRVIAQRYGGSVMIHTENQIFSLEILIPT